MDHLHEEVAEEVHDLTINPVYDLTEAGVGDKIPDKHLRTCIHKHSRGLFGKKFSQAAEKSLKKRQLSRTFFLCLREIFLKNATAPAYEYRF